MIINRIENHDIEEERIKYEKNKNYYDDLYHYWSLINTLIIFGYVLFLLLWRNTILQTYDSDILKMISTGIIWFIPATLTYFILSAFIISIPPFLKSITKKGVITKKFFWTLYLISFIVVFLYSVFSNYTIKSEYEYYTTNYETFHLYDDCITIEKKSNLENLHYEDINEKNICSVCKWHFETSQQLNKKNKK